MSETIPSPDAQRPYFAALAADLSLLAEQKRQQEALHFRNTCELAAAVAAPEVKLAILLTHATFEGAATSWRVLQEMKRRCAGQQAWFPSATDMYYKKGFVLRNLVTEERDRTRGPNAPLSHLFTFDHENPVLKGALGLFAGWSLDHAELSTRQVLGSPNTRGGFRAAEPRLNAMLELLTHPAGSRLGNNELAGLSNLKNTTFVHMLVDGGMRDEWLTMETITQNNDTLYRVGSQGVAFERASLTHAVGRCYRDFLQTRQPGDTFTRQEVLDAVLSSVVRLDPHIDLAAARRKLATVLPNVRPRLGVERVRQFNRGYNTRLSIAEAHRPAIEELAEIILAIHDRDPAMLAEGERRAQEIVDNPQDLATLLNKSAKFSLNAQAETKVILTNFRHVLGVSERPLTAVEIMQAFREMGLRPPSREITLQYAKRLALAEEIRLVGERKLPSMRRQIYRFEPKIMPDWQRVAAAINPELLQPGPSLLGSPELEAHEAFLAVLGLAPTAEKDTLSDIVYAARVARKRLIHLNTWLGASERHMLEMIAAHEPAARRALGMRLLPHVLRIIEDRQPPLTQERKIDALSVGAIALMDTMRWYTPQSGFSIEAAVRRSVIQALADEPVKEMRPRTGRTMARMLLRIERAARELAKSGDMSDMVEVGARLGFSRERVREALRLQAIETGQLTAELADELPDPEALQAFAAAEDQIMLRKIWQTARELYRRRELSEVEWAVLTARYIGGDFQHTIADRLPQRLDRSSISLAEKRALAKIRRAIFTGEFQSRQPSVPAHVKKPADLLDLLDITITPSMNIEETVRNLIDTVPMMQIWRNVLHATLGTTAKAIGPEDYSKQVGRALSTLWSARIAGVRAIAKAWAAMTSEQKVQALHSRPATPPTLASRGIRKSSTSLTTGEK